MLILVDGNNLLHAARGELEAFDLGRVHLCDRLGRWAAAERCPIEVIFDGPWPPRGVVQQMQFRGLKVRFSASRTADELIEESIDRSRCPTQLWVVTSDRAIQSVARRRRSRCTSCAEFLTLLGPGDAKPSRANPRRVAPDPVADDVSADDVSADDVSVDEVSVDDVSVDQWLRAFGYPTDDPPEESETPM